MQAVEELLPVDGLYVPAAQAVHTFGLPVDGLYVPAAQAMQVAWPAVLYVPAAQAMQAVEELLPVDGL
jgi:hypothetical protein